MKTIESVNCKAQDRLGEGMNKIILTAFTMAAMAGGIGLSAESYQRYGSQKPMKHRKKKGSANYRKGSKGKRNKFYLR